MNLLAHAYLSLGNADILTGNMIGDFVKGNKKYNYPDKIRRGIELHRSIDSFTDTHEATKKIKSLFRPVYGLYSGAFVDIVYDHFLANDVKLFINEGVFFDFTQHIYNQLSTRKSYFPEKFEFMFSRMCEQNWLYHYRFDEGIEQSFTGLMRRARFINQIDEAFTIFKQNKPYLKMGYDSFFPDINNHVHHFLKI